MKTTYYTPVVLVCFINSSAIMAISDEPKETPATPVDGKPTAPSRGLYI